MDKNRQYLNSWQNDVTHALLSEQQVDELVHVRELELAVAVLEPDLAVIVQERLQVLVAVERGASQTKIVRAKSSNIPIEKSGILGRMLELTC